MASTSTAKAAPEARGTGFKTDRLTGAIIFAGNGSNKVRQVAGASLVLTRAA